MAKRMVAFGVFGSAVLALMTGAGPATAGDAQAALQSAAPAQTALSDAEMSDARGAGLFGLPTGSSVYAWIGSSSSSKTSPGSPSAASVSLTGDGTTLGGSSSLGPGPGLIPNLSVNQSFSLAETLPASHSFTISFSGF